MAAVGLVVALVLHFVPGYTEIVELLSPKEIQEVRLECTPPVEDDLILYPSDQDYRGEKQNYITFPISCRLFNNTSAPISIVKYGPALISKRQSYALLFEEAKGGITPVIANGLNDEIVERNSKIPLLLQPREVWEFNSLFAIDYVEIELEEQVGCHEPTQENIDAWSGFVCIADEPLPFTNYLYTPLSVGFWDWDEYGQVVVLGDGRVIYHSAEKFMYVADCSEEDPERTAIPFCKSSPRFVAPSTWMVN